MSNGKILLTTAEHRSSKKRVEGEGSGTIELQNVLSEKGQGSSWLHTEPHKSQTLCLRTFSKYLFNSSGLVL